MCLRSHDEHKCKIWTLKLDLGTSDPGVTVVLWHHLSLLGDGSSQGRRTIPKQHQTSYFSKERIMQLTTTLVESSVRSDQTCDR